ncbi:hypothetical protein LXL04_006564 [Taraxacum kok-saghyz]
MIDLNNGFHDEIWNPFHDDKKTHKISGPTNSNHCNYFLTTQTIDGYAKEQIRETILKHESIFKHQLQELHRLHKRQQDLMNLTKETRIFASGFPPLTSTFRPLESLNGKSLNVPERRPIDLQLSTNEQQVGIFQKLTDKKPFTFTDLNEPITPKKTLFGVEINTGHLNHFGSFDSAIQNPGFFSVNSRSTVTNSEWQNRNKHEQQPLPLWLTKGKESTIHHINLNSLQNHSHQFFKKADVADGNQTREFKKVKLDDSSTITKILGVPIIETKIESNIRHDIDLNLSLEIEEEDPPPATPSSPENTSAMDSDLELATIAAEAIVSISIFQQPPENPIDNLTWFADVITNELEKSLVEKSEEIDYFEYMTLKLQDSKENYDDFYKPVTTEDEKVADNTSLLLKRTPRKGQGKRGKQKKDFQKDILPNIVTLSRREVTEDLQIFEDVFSSTGVFWQSSLSKRKSGGGGRSGRGRRRGMVVEPSCRPLPPPEQCRELALEKSLGGWGRRTRRLPRQRCSNGGSHYRSLALKC